MLLFVVKISSFAKGQNPKTDIHNQKLGRASKKYYSVISVRKTKREAHWKIVFLLDTPAHTESQGENHIWMITFYKLILLHASEIFFEI